MPKYSLKKEIMNSKKEAEEIFENGEKFIESIAQHLKEKKIL